MPSKLVFLSVASPVACAFSSNLPVAYKLLHQDMSQCLGSNGFHWPSVTHACMHAHMQSGKAYEDSDFTIVIAVMHW